MNNNADSQSSHPPANSTETWRFVAPVHHIPAGVIFSIEIEENSLMLWRDGQTIKCYRDACTHLAYPIAMGKVKAGILTCPFHRFQYRLDTGECLTAATSPLESFPVKVEDNQIFVRVNS